MTRGAREAAGAVSKRTGISPNIQCIMWGLASALTFSGYHTSVILEYQKKEDQYRQAMDAKRMTQFKLAEQNIRLERLESKLEDLKINKK